MSDDLRRLGRNLAVLGLLYAAGMAAVYGFSLMNVSTLVIFPVFILGILVAYLESDSGIWGAVQSLSGASVCDPSFVGMGINATFLSPAGGHRYYPALNVSGGGVGLRGTIACQQKKTSRVEESGCESRTVPPL